MTELERRHFLLWSAGSAFAFLTACFERQGRAAVAYLLDPTGAAAGDGGKPGSAPATRPAASKDVKPGPQTDGSFVLDPANPPAPAVKQEKGNPNGHYVTVAGETVLVGQKSDKKGWLAIAAICTHKRCAVNFEPDKAQFKCPCHGSTFTAAGKVQKGPAKDDLAAFAVTEIKGAGGKPWVRVSKK